MLRKPASRRPAVGKSKKKLHHTRRKLFMEGLEDRSLLATVFINEFHYDNSGTDSGEFIEIAGPAGTDLSTWSLVLYNGGTPYDTDALTGTIDNEGGTGFGAVSFPYPTDGIQNGPADGIALVNGVTVVQFLSYEGVITATSGVANGMTSTDVGVSETTSTPVGNSLRLTGTGSQSQDFTWNAPAANSAGSINPGQTFVADTTPPTVSIDDGDVDNTVVTGASLTYTLTFSEDINAATVTAADFVNAGTSAITIGTITETSPGVFTVVVTPSNVGTLQLRIPTGSVISDNAGNNLVVPATDVDVLNVVAPSVNVVQSGGNTTITEDGGTDTLSISLISNPSANVVVTVTPANSYINLGAGAGVAVTLTFTNANGTTPQIVPVSTANNRLIEGPRTSAVSYTVASADLSYNDLSVSNTTINITDSTGPGIVVVQSAGSTTISEDGALLDSFTVALGNTTPAPTGNVTITLTPTSQVNLGSGIGAPHTLTFTPGNATTPQTVNASTAQDTAAEGLQSNLIAFTSSSADANYNSWAGTAVNVQIQDDNDGDAPATLSIPTTLTGNNGSTVLVPIRFNSQIIRSGTQALTAFGLEFSYLASQGNTVAAPTLSQAAISAGATLQTTNQATDGLFGAVITFTTPFEGNFNNDLLYVPFFIEEVSGTVPLNLNANNTVFKANGNEMTLTPAPTAGSESIDGLISLPAAPPLIDVTQSGGNTNVAEGGATDTVGISLVGTQNTSQTVSPSIVTVTVTPSNAQVDIGAGAGVARTFTFEPGNMQVVQSFTVTAIDDLVNEGNHTTTFTFTSSSANTAYHNLSNLIIANIADNDGAPPGVTVGQSGGTSDVTEGGATDTITVVLDSEPTDVVEITIDVGTQLAVDIDFLEFDSSNWNIPQVVTISAVNDVVVEGPHSGVLSFSVGSGDNNYQGLPVGSVTVNITDNDFAGPTVTSINDNDGDDLVAVGVMQTYTITFSADIDHTTFTAADLDNQGTSAITIGTITETGPTTGVFNVQVTPTTAGTLILRIPAGAVITAQAGGNLVTPVADDTTVTVQALPTVTFNDNDADDLVLVNVMQTYTVQFSVDMDHTTFTAADLNNAGTSAITIGTITEGSPGVFSVQVTPTTAGTVILRIPTGSVVTSVAGGNLVVPQQDDTTVTVENLPTVTFDDGDLDNTVLVGAVLSYTITFSTDIDHTTFTTADLNNAGTAPVSIGSPVEGSPGVFTVSVTANGTGTIILRIPTGSVVTSTAGGNLVVPVQDNDTVTVNPAAPSTTTFINEVLFSPGDFSANEYIEFRGVASSTIAANTYFVVLDGDSTGPGQIDQVINLSGATIGTNGYLAVVKSGHPFSITSGSGVLTATWNPFENQSASYLLVTSTVAPIVGGDADSNDDGVLDGVTWTILDSVAALDSSGADLAYAALVYKYATGSAVDMDGGGAAPAPNVIRVDQAPYNLVNGTPAYLARLGDSTGSTAADWLYTDTETMATQTASPLVYRVGGNVAPLNMINTLLNHLGTTNPSAPPPPGVNVGAISGSTTEAGGTATFSVVLNTQPTADVTVPVTSLDTTEGTVSTALLTFTNANWNTPQIVTVTGVNDAIDDGDIVFTVQLGNTTSTDPNYNNVNPADVSVTNVDNDTRGVTVSAISGNTTEGGGTATFTIVLTSEPTASVTIPLVSSDTTEGTVVASVTFTTANWMNPQTITVTGVNDDVDDGDIAYSINTQPATGGDYAGFDANNVNVTNTDNDTRGVTVSAISGNTTEGGGTATFTIVLTSEPTATVTIPLVSSDTTEGTVVASVVFTTSNWMNPQTVTVTGVNDDVDDGDIAYSINTQPATGGDYAGFDAANVNVTNTDNDTRGVTVSAISGNTTEGGGTATFTIVLTSEPTATVTIPLVSSDTTEGTVVASVTFTTANWMNPQTITVTGVNDDVDDGDIAYSINTQPATGGDYAGFDANNVNVTNTDNDTRGVTVSAISGNTTEGGGTATFTIVLTSEPTATVTIPLVSSDTTEGTVVASVVFTTSNWNQAQTITVTGVNDDVDDGDIAYSINTQPATGGDYAGFDAANVNVINTDNDTVGFTVTPTSGLVTTEGGGTATFTVRLNSEPTANVTISINSLLAAEGTAAPSSLTFTNLNWNTTQTVTVTGQDDAIVDGNVVYTIATGAAASSDPLYSGLNPADVTVTNNDNDSLTFSVNVVASTIAENAGAAATTVVITRNGNGSTPAQVVNLLSNDTSEATIQATVNMPLGVNSVTVNLDAVDDLVADGNQTVTITASASGYISGQDTVVVTDNENPGVTVNPTSGLTTTEAGGTATFSVVLNTQPTANVIISLTSLDPTEGTVPATITFTTGNWNVAQNVTVTGADDFIIDGNVAYTIQTTASSGDANYNNIAVADVTLTNTDNDVAGFIITPTSGLVTNEAGLTANFTVRLASQPSADVTIGLSSSDTTEGTVSPPSLTFSNGNWNVNQLVTITGVNDLIADGNIAYTIVTAAASSADSNYNTLNPADVSVTNNDNDTAGVTVSAISGNTTEAGGTATFNVVLTSQPTADVTINLVSSDTTEGTVPASIVFTTANWNTVQTVTVTGVNDPIVDGNIAYTIQTTVSSSDTTYAAINPADVAVTNVDNDVAGVTVNPTSGLTTTEAGGTATFTVVLTSQPSANVTINLLSLDTTEGTVPASIVFTNANWNVAQTVTVTGADDLIADGAVLYTIQTTASSSDSNYNGITVADVTVTNTDNDVAGVTVNPTSGLTTTEAGGTATFTVVLTSQPTANVTINLLSSDTTEGTVPTSIVFTNVTWNTPQTVTVTGVNDLIADGDIAYTIQTTATSSDTAYNGITVADVSVTNTDNDIAGVTVNPTAGLTTTEAGGTATFTVILNTQPTANVTINLVSSDTTEGTVPAGITFTTGNWNIAQTVTVTGVNDALVDGNIAYTIQTTASSSDAAYNNIAVADVAVTNNDNDAAGVTITPSTGLITTEAGGTATFSVVLAAQPSANVTINLTSSNTNEGTVPAGVTFTNANWNTPQIVTVTGVDDFVDDGNVGYTIVTTVTSSDAAFAAVNPVDVSVTNSDNDTVGITMTQSGGTTNVVEGGATDTLSFVLNSQPTSNVTIALNTGAQLSSNVPSVVFTPGNWNVTQNVTISAVDDAISEGNHTGTISFSVTSSDPLYASQAIGNVTANIGDNDNVGPTAVNDGVYNMFTNTTLVVNNVGPHGLGVLANDIDPDSVTLTAVLSPPVQASLAPHTLVLNSNGSFSFTPQTGFTGPVTFTYLADDGLQQSSLATVSINVVSLTGLTPVINGQADADNIIIRRATNGTDVEVLVDGVVQSPFPLPYSSLASITVNGLGGNDNFQVDYTNGDPVPPGGVIVNGDAGTDTLNVNGMDAITTGRTVTATETTIDGIGAGVLADVTFGTFETVNLSLTGGDDIITTDLDNGASPITTYTIMGRGGNDTYNSPDVTNLPVLNLWGGAGDDTFGSSTDRVFPSVSSRINIGGEESNTGPNLPAPTGDRLWLDITNASGVVSLIDTVGGNVQGIGFTDMQFHGIELFDATDNGPLVLPLGEAYTHGYDWEQHFNYYNQSGNLFLDYRSPGGTRTFPLLGIPSLMTTLGGNLNDTMSMNFTLNGVVRSAFYGQGGDDRLTGSAGADLLVGGPGNDNISGGGGSDEIWGDERSTVLNGIPRDGLATGGNDTLNGGDGDDFIFGGGGSDYILDAGGNDYLMGGLGNDIITDTAGDNFLRGGEGGDQLTGGSGRDILVAGAGNDRLIGRANTDFMLAGDGADIIQDDSAGNDVSIADISPYDNDVMVFTQPGTSISGLSNNDLALQQLMFTGVGAIRPNAWSGATVPGALTASPAAFSVRVTNLAGLAASLTADGDVDQILGNVGDVDYILSEQTRDVRLNVQNDTYYFV